MILIWNLDLGHLISTLSYLATPIPKTCRFMICDNLLLAHEGLPQVLVLTVHLVNILVWMGKGNHSETFLLLVLFCWSTPSWLKVIGGGVGVGGPCDYCVSPSPNNCISGFFRLGLNLWSGFGACWDR